MVVVQHNASWCNARYCIAWCGLLRLSASTFEKMGALVGGFGVIFVHSARIDDDDHWSGFDVANPVPTVQSITSLYRTRIR